MSRMREGINQGTSRDTREHGIAGKFANKLRPGKDTIQLVIHSLVILSEMFIPPSPLYFNCIFNLFEKKD